MTACPLCSGKNIDFYHADAAREYLHCEGCELVFVASQFHLKPAGEKARYDLHRNTTEDDGYIRFLSRLADPLLERLPSGQFGLDFGCGPGPVLSEILKKAGHRIELFDPYYRNDRQVLNMKFDFITATEVVEHMSRPGIEFERLFEMLKSGGILGLMTRMVKDRESFGSWHYIHDLTHISFFSSRSFRYLAERHNAELEFIEDGVILMTKP